MKRQQRQLSRVLGFSLLPACSLLASLALLPLISMRFGPAAWSTITVGQSTGAIASIVVGLTWSIEGGNLVARATPEERGRLYVCSVASQLIVLVIVGLVTVLVTLAIAPTYKLAAVLFAVGTTLNGLTAAWYYSGIGRALPLLLNEGVVRLLGYVLALVGVLLGANLLWYAAVTVAAGLVMALANWLTIVVVPRVNVPRDAFREGWRTVRSESFGTVSRLLGSVYSFGGPSIFAALSSFGLADYSAARTVQGAAANGLSAIPNAFVSWVGGAPEHERRVRIRQTQLLMASFSAVILIATVALGPIALNYLFAGRLELPFVDLVLMSVGIALSFYNRTYQVLVLVPLGRKSLVYRSTMVSSMVGLGLYVVLIPLLGVSGGLLSPVLVVAGLQLWYYRAIRRPAPAAGAPVTRRAAGHAVLTPDTPASDGSA